VFNKRVHLLVKRILYVRRLDHMKLVQNNLLWKANVNSGVTQNLHNAVIT